MDFESIQQYLNELSEKYELVNVAMEGCQTWIDETWKERDIASFGGFAKEELKLAFDQHDFVFNHYFWQRLVIRTRIGIYVNDTAKVWARNLKPIGYYEMETDEQGQTIDDWFVIEKEKEDELNIISQIRSLNTLLPEGALKRNKIYYEYVTYVHHVVAFFQSQQYDATAQGIRRAFVYLKDNPKLFSETPYFKRSKYLLKMILHHLIEKNLLTEITLGELKRAGIIKGGN
ncbi:hypothetical protein QNI19_24185 [Cytophagaceae bacterium DM2B3-1]|uniref:Uncharacterized protein n=1 Tax=Xanthocytophaga flava TaxID=3048013 RepID=A0ABT7CSV9_9BACT|nr:hypothetical protein [Xanthocytophaga flavus]MDJ1496057.1 hypothetical protein [Xanthocytophaga flavus]